jgi:FkbM family methyltransferase
MNRLRKVAIGVLERLGLIMYVRFALEKLRRPTKATRSMHAARKEFYRQFVKPGDTCFDIGANLGNRVEVFLDLGAKVVAVEPQTSCATYLRLKFGSKITLLKKAVGESEGEAQIYLSNAATLSSMSTSWIASMKQGRFAEFSWEKSERITVTTLDQLIRDYGVPSFCKIDVEGYEHAVLSGLTRPLPALSFEFAVPEAEEQATQCLDLLGRLGPAQCNYSEGEEMQFGLSEWVDSERMKEVISAFASGGITFGDIYIRFV